MRRWKRIVYCLIAYDILLIPAILLLEWHYVVDLIGGVAVALIAIWINNSREMARESDQRDISGALAEPTSGMEPVFAPSSLSG
jgi:hypothetical protein